MNPVLIEVHCNLPADDPNWKEIEGLQLEIGYPGRGGQTLWKHIGWLRDQMTPAGRQFAQAIWSQEMTNHVLVFDFLPVITSQGKGPEKSYRIRKSVTTASGRSKKIGTRLLKGDYHDEHFAFHPIYPEPYPI
jgi:hypothetical protein